MYNNYYNTTVTDTEEENEHYVSQKKVRAAKYCISFLLAATGFLILGVQLAPLANSYIKGKRLENQTVSIKDPAPTFELNPDSNDLPYYDPGMSYFQNLIQHMNTDEIVAGATTPSITYPTQEDVFIDSNYSTAMLISIPRIEVSSITITPNVPSLEEDVYNAALKKGLAHFEGTPLPGDGGNSFIYGHSAPESFFTNHQNDPETIFSQLENVEIADTVTIEKDGKILEYTVQKKKITDPDDFEVLSGIPGKQTITLMSCWPNGIGTQRLIVIAELVNAE